MFFFLLNWGIGIRYPVGFQMPKANVSFYVALFLFHAC